MVVVLQVLEPAPSSALSHCRVRVLGVAENPHQATDALGWSMGGSTATPKPRHGACPALAPRLSRPPSGSLLRRKGHHGPKWDSGLIIPFPRQVPSRLRGLTSAPLFRDLAWAPRPEFPWRPSY
eukprot:3140939-Pleurochrysis_carterae.AAC.3